MTPPAAFVTFNDRTCGRGVSALTVPPSWYAAPSTVATVVVGVGSVMAKWKTTGTLKYDPATKGWPFAVMVTAGLPFANGKVYASVLVCPALSVAVTLMVWTPCCVSTVPLVTALLSSVAVTLPGTSLRGTLWPTTRYAPRAFSGASPPTVSALP